MKTAAVVVSYRPTAMLVDIVATLTATLDRVIVVDNASGPASAGRLERCRASGAEIIRNATNHGIAHALNQGLEVLDSSYDWAFTFDQDSTLGAEALRRLTTTAEEAAAEVGLVAPRIIDVSGSVLQAAGDTDKGEVRRALTSGSCVRMSAFRSIEGFREDLFIDYVDFDFCARLRAHGWRIVVDAGAVMRHSLGATDLRSVGGIRVPVSHHSADRQYYKYRNFLLLLREPAFRRDDRAWLLRSLLSLSLGPAKILLFERGRAAKVRGIVAGVYDGFRGVAGPRPT